MRPPEVLDQQSALLDRLDTTPYQAYFREWVRVDILTGRFDTAEADVVSYADDHLDWIRRSLQIALAYHVRSDMVPLVRVAAADLEEDDHLSHQILPSEHGFLVFDEPIAFIDAYGGPSNIAALSWGHSGSDGMAGAWITAWRDRDLYYRQYQEGGGEISDVAQEASFAAELGALVIEQRWFLPYGRSLGLSTGLSEHLYARLATEREYLSEEADNISRLVVALLRLFGQTIVEVREEKPDRATARRAARKNLTPQVRTVKLRRKKYVDPAHQDTRSVEWQHSWVVRGHWAWRACGEDHVSAEPYEKGHRVRVYIAPYVKGPEGKPFQVGDKVWSLAQ